MLLVHSCLRDIQVKSGWFIDSKQLQRTHFIPGNTPSCPFTRPVHQSSAFGVRFTISIRSPTLKLKSPSAYSHQTHEHTRPQVGGRAKTGKPKTHLSNKIVQSDNVLCWRFRFWLRCRDRRRCSLGPCGGSARSSVRRRRSG